MLKNTRTMKMMLAAVAAVGLSLSAAQASAVQTTTVFPGSACQARLGSVNLIDHSLWGVDSVNQTAFTTASWDLRGGLTALVGSDGFRYRNKGDAP